MALKKVMIVGASALQVPIIQKAKELGYEVGVVDFNPNAVGIKYADWFHNVSTIDANGVCKATEEFEASGITTVATDMPMRAIAYTCDKLGLIGISEETALNATDKARMIKKFEEFNVPHSRYSVVENKKIEEIKENIIYPCICKPVDNSGSRGVIIANNDSELHSGIEYSYENSRSGTVIVEELLIGREISVEAFAVNGSFYVIQITDKITTGAPHFVEMGHSQPSEAIATMYQEIYDITAKAMLAVGIQNGPAHVEMMLTENGPKLIEIGARLGGDFITTDLVPLSTGIDILAATIRLACGDKVDIEPKFNRASAIRYMKTGIGKIKSITGLEEASEINGVYRVSMQKNIGDMAEEICDSIDRVGYVIAQGESIEEASSICEKALKKIAVKVE